jgi:hypothetical protein
MWLSFRVSQPLGDAVSVKDILEPGKDATQPCLQSSLLSRGQLLGDREPLEACQRLLYLIEASLQHGRGRRDSGGRLSYRAHYGKRRSQHRSPVRLVCHAIGGKQQEGLADREPRSLACGQQSLLVFRLQAAKGMGQSGTDGPTGEPVLGPWAQAPADQQSTSHPLGSASEPPGDGEGAQALLGGEGADNAGLIQGGERAWGRVGQQQQAFVLHAVAGRLDDHRDLPPSLLSPALQALEPVDDLEAPVLGGYDADG